MEVVLFVLYNYKYQNLSKYGTSHLIILLPIYLPYLVKAIRFTLNLYASF